MHRQRNQEKSKNFFKAITRLFKELKIFKIIIVISLVMASVSSILSIIAPDKLSKITDEISHGLVIKKDNLEKIYTNITNSLSNIDVNKIYMNVKENESSEFLIKLQSIGEDKNKLINLLSESSNDILNICLPAYKIDNISITSKDQLEFMKIMSSLSDQSSPQEMYKKIDELPNNIYNVVKPFMDIEKIKSICLMLVLFYIMSAIFSFIQSILMTIVSNKFAKELRTRISYKINKLPLKYFDNNQVGDILSRITNDIDTIAQTMNQSLPTLVSSLTLFIGTTIMMFVTNYIMAITAILSSMIGFILMGAILSKSQKYFKDRQKELGKLNSHIEEVYSGLLVVKAYNGKKESDKKFNELNQKVKDANRKSQYLAGLMPTIMMFIGNFGYVAVCIVGAILTSKSIISFGVIVAFITYVRLFTQPLSQIAQAFTALQSTAASSERVFEFLDEEEKNEEINVSKVLDKNSVKGNISFEHVKFGYNEDKIIIKDFTANVKEGQKIAIVGPTGAGKTTMVNLLMKFYDINDGDIKIDDISIKDLSRENIHSLFTMVLQDTWLFNGSIRDNIVFNNENVNDKELNDVCERVGLKHFINTLPSNYNTIIEENDSISSGQKQLLTIARGMIDNAPFLILDEATSNVDTRTEEQVQKAMDELMKGKTSFIIAHRLSTIKNADLILVMKDGNIIEQGNHDYLLKQNGFYAELYNSQFSQ